MSNAQSNLFVCGRRCAPGTVAFALEQNELTRTCSANEQVTLSRETGSCTHQKLKISVVTNYRLLWEKLGEKC